MMLFASRSEPFLPFIRFVLMLPYCAAQLYWANGLFLNRMHFHSAHPSEGLLWLAVPLFITLLAWSWVQYSCDAAGTEKDG
jgi:hypothetical protein